MTEPTESHLLFACGPSWYAVPADAAAEVVLFPDLTRVPGAPAHLLGVFAHRGEVIPVIDLPRLTGGVLQDSRRGVLVRLKTGSFALTATKVAGVAPVAASLEPLGTAGVRLHLKGPAHTPRGEAAVIDPQGLFEFLSQGG